MVFSNKSRAIAPPFQCASSYNNCCWPQVTSCLPPCYDCCPQPCNTGCCGPTQGCCGPTQGCCGPTQGCCGPTQGCCGPTQGCCGPTQGCCGPTQGCCGPTQGCCGQCNVAVFQDAINATAATGNKFNPLACCKVKGYFPPPCNPCGSLDPVAQLQYLIDTRSCNPFENIALTLLLKKVQNQA